MDNIQKIKLLNELMSKNPAKCRFYAAQWQLLRGTAGYEPIHTWGWQNVISKSRVAWKRVRQSPPT